METGTFITLVIVAAIIICAAVYVYKTRKKCPCGCTGCSLKDSCEKK
ncbi:MAG: FeoB-associated Cys-rich membrane protein [Clostridiales bacterium]|jgi:hypothetical protein|nr:FeoB-associated Cys-rich membrane protein [Clostridiales bacterium]